MDVYDGIHGRNVLEHRSMPEYELQDHGIFPSRELVERDVQTQPTLSIQGHAGGNGGGGGGGGRDTHLHGREGSRLYRWILFFLEFGFEPTVEARGTNPNVRIRRGPQVPEGG